jgi:hypothetical protein
MQTGDLFVGLRVPKVAGASGIATLYFDGDHQTTLEGTGCGTRGVAPGPEDRRFVVEYNAATGSAIVAEQKRGTCGTGSAWEDVPAAEAWSMAVAADEPAEDPGFQHVEAVFTTPPGLTSASSFGMAATLESGPTRLRLPKYDGSPPLDDDVSSWQMVTYGNMAEVERIGGIRVDGVPKR